MTSPGDAPGSLHLYHNVSQRSLERILRCALSGQTSTPELLEAAKAITPGFCPPEDKLGKSRQPNELGAPAGGRLTGKFPKSLRQKTCPIPDTKPELRDGPWLLTRRHWIPACAGITLLRALKALPKSMDSNT